MLNAETKRHIDAARDVLVGVAPNPMTQVDQITYALIYKFMDDMDQSAIKLGGEPSFFVGDLEPYAYSTLMDPRLGNQERMNLYAEALTKFAEAKQLPELFRTIFRAAFLPYRSPETLGLFLKEINFFDYSHPEELGNAYEYLLSIMSAQGDAGQFRTPRHIIDFMVDVLDPTKTDRVLDPACGTGGFLVSSYNHILENHDGKDDPTRQEKPLTPDERRKLMENFEGYDIDPSMVRIAQVNMYLHLFKNPKIYQYDSLTSEERWNDKFDVILANPPFMSPKGGIKPHNKFGIQSNRSEVLFVDYILEHLKPQGRTAIIVPEGIIFQSGNAYKSLRKQLVEQGLHAVVSLPSGVFQPYSGVKTSILFLDKNKGPGLSSVLFADVRTVGVSLGASKKSLDSNDLPAAANAIADHLDGHQVSSTKLLSEVPKEDIAEIDFILSLSSYRRDSETNSAFALLPLGEICEIQKGKSSSTKTLPGPYPLHLTAATPKSADHFDFDRDGVAVPLISSRGHGVAEVSRVHFVSGQYALADLLAVVSPKDPEQLNPRFLYWILEGSKPQLADLMKGAANVGMKVSDLAGFEIPLPPISIQRQTVTMLEAYVALVNGVRQVVANWKPTLIPNKTWEKKTLADVADWSSGGTPKSGHQDYYGGDILWAVIGDLTEDLVTITEKKLTHLGLRESSAKIVPEDTVLLAMYGASIGKTGIAGIPMATNQAIACARCNPDVIDPWFLLYFLQSQKQQFVAAGAGGAQPNISQAIVKSWPILLPPIDEQREILKSIHRERTQVLALAELQKTYEDRIRTSIYDLWHVGVLDE